MVAAVQQGGLHAYHGISGQHTVLGGLPYTLFYRREEVLRHTAAEHILGKFNAFALNGLELNPDIAELAMSAGLFLVAALGLAALTDGFTVRYPRVFQREVPAGFPA